MTLFHLFVNFFAFSALVVRILMPFIVVESVYKQFKNKSRTIAK